MEKVIERFLKYISYDTKSDPQNGEKKNPLVKANGI